MATIAPNRLIATISLLVGLIVPPGHARSLYDGTDGNVWLGDKSLVIVMGKITRVTLPPPPGPNQQIQEPIPVSYNVEVVCECQNRIKSKTSVQIKGEWGVQGSAPVNIPRYEVGDTILLALKPTPTHDAFDFAGNVTLPLGVETPRAVDAKDVEPLRVALLYYGQATRESAATLSRDAVTALLKDKNPYLWALAVTQLAANGTEEDAGILLGFYRSANETLSQILWVDHCLDRVFQGKYQPSIQRRHSELLYYIEHHGATDGRDVGESSGMAGIRKGEAHQ